MCAQPKSEPACLGDLSQNSWIDEILCLLGVVLGLYPAIYGVSDLLPHFDILEGSTAEVEQEVEQLGGDALVVEMVPCTEYYPLTFTPIQQAEILHAQDDLDPSVLRQVRYYILAD